MKRTFNYFLIVTIFVLLLPQISFSNQSYCTPITLPNCCQWIPIENVNFAGINNSTFCDNPNGYSDYTLGTPAIVKRGGVYTLSVTYGIGAVLNTDFFNPRTTAATYIVAWIDWNQNGSFTDSGERYILAVSTYDSSFTFQIPVTIPLTADTGTTRMRIMSESAPLSNPPISSCGHALFGFGEYQDYSVHVSDPDADPVFGIFPLSKDFYVQEITVPSDPSFFTIRNNSGGTLQVNSAMLDSNEDGLLNFSLNDTNTYPKFLNAGEEMFFSVQYTPSAVNYNEAKLVINHGTNDAIYEALLSGSGIVVNFGSNGLSGDDLYYFSNSSFGGSIAPSQPVYAWRSTDSATLLCQNGVDLSSGLNTGGLINGRFNLVDILPAGHSMKFFGEEYTSLYVSINGVVGFVAGSAIAPSALPNLPQFQVPVAVLPFWYTLNANYTNMPGEISYEVKENEVIITYYRISRNLSPGTINAFTNTYFTFQVIIEHSISPTQNSRITFQYNWDETGPDVQDLWLSGNIDAGGLLIGLQGAFNINKTARYRARFYGYRGIIFSSPLAVQFGPDENALPVDLVSFTSLVDERDVTLNWTTAWEENNMMFDVQRRPVILSGSEESIWNTIGSVSGSGTVYEERQYSFTDKNLVTGKYEYRLIQIDYNGNSTADHSLSNIVEIGVPSTFALSQNYPNPFNPVTKIAFQIPLEGLTKLVIFDMSGREVATLVNELMSPGYYTYLFNGANFSSGVYFYRLVSGSNVITKKFLLLK